jgi:UDP-N-acetylenolpyruvoylglucosamine reductase
MRFKNYVNDIIKKQGATKETCNNIINDHRLTQYEVRDLCRICQNKVFQVLGMNMCRREYEAKKRQ